MRYVAEAVPAEVAVQIAESGDGALIERFLARGLDLGKNWHAAQVLISGSLEAVEPLLTGVPVGEDLGFGPAILASPEEVARVAESLEGLSEDVLAGRFDPAVMEAQMVYPMAWDEDSDWSSEEVVEASVALVGLYRSASARGSGVIAAIR